MPIETTPWDTAEFLDTPEMRAAYWDEVLADFEETGDAAFMRKCLTTLERAMTMHGASFGEALTQSAKEALAIAEGKAVPAAVYHPQEADLAAVQERVRNAGFKRLPDEKAFLDDLSGDL